MVKSVRASFLSAQKFGTRTRGRPLLSNAGRRARTPTLMPGRSLTRPCPGTGTPPSQFVSGLSACLSLQRARFHPPPRSNVAVAGNPSLRSNAFMRAVGVTTSPLRGSSWNSRFALAEGIESAACFQSFAPGWHSLPQSSQTGQPSQTAECGGAPAQTRERALRAPSRHWLAGWA